MRAEHASRWRIAAALMIWTAGCATGGVVGSRGSPAAPFPRGPDEVRESTGTVAAAGESSARSAPSPGDAAFGELLAKFANTPGPNGAGADLPPTVSDENRDLIGALEDQRLAAVENERGVVVTLPDVLFEFGSSDLTFGGKRKIRAIADTVLRLAGGRRIAVEGHTDSIGAELYNQALSERRAEAVAGQLKNAGVPEALVGAKGFGEAYPVAPNEYPDGADNPAGRAKNRRVEIVIEN